MHWNACFLPDDYQRKLKQNLAESEEAVENEARVDDCEGFKPERFGSGGKE